MSTLVRTATKLALDERGDHLSPKYIPEIIEAPTILTSIFPLLAIAIRAIPIVLAVPNELPRKKAIILVMRKEKNMKRPGFINFIPKYTIPGIVPEESQLAVKAPTNINIIKTTLDFLLYSREISIIESSVFSFFSASRANPIYTIKTIIPRVNLFTATYENKKKEHKQK